MIGSRPLLILVHGWGFDAGFWQPLRACLPEYDCRCLDFGFFGPPTPIPELVPELAPGQPVVAIGHSLGAQWLLAMRPLAWSALVAINGFPRFTEAPGYTPAVPARPLERMIRRLPQAPEVTTEAFRRRCGCAEPLPGLPNPARLLEGLGWLRDLDGRSHDHDAPILALSGGADPILPPGMAENCWSGFTTVERHELASAGHLLPLEHPQWCAERLTSWLAGNS
ncbi:pimeloyl-(acyl-carrier protein) methyl ester esterase [uncultured Gammaproteobacteria bacterium]